METVTRSRKQGKVGVPVWGGGAVQGHVTEEGRRVVFVRYVTWTRHFFRLDTGWSVSGQILAQLEQLAVMVLRYVDDSGGTWEIGLEDFKRHAIRRYFGEIQFIVPLDHWVHRQREASAQLALAI